MHNEGDEEPIIPEESEATGESESSVETEAPVEDGTDGTEPPTAEIDPVEAAALGGISPLAFYSGFAATRMSTMAKTLHGHLTLTPANSSYPARAR